MALLVAAEKGGVSRQELLRSHPVLRSEPFDSETRRMSVTVTQAQGRTYWKGAADAILPLCGFQMRDGKTVPFSEKRPCGCSPGVTELSDQAPGAGVCRGGRACVFWGLPECWIRPENPPDCHPHLRQSQHPHGHDYRRPQEHRRRHCETGRTAPGQKGDDRRRTGRLSDAQLDACLDQYTVFARVNPAHKLRLVRAYRRRGEIVAMTGDG
ncbi:MAG: hypothetical protein ACLR5S_07480 [Ruminococcus sp.]